MIKLFRIFEEVETFIKLVFKFPMRMVCKHKEHQWLYHQGFFLFENKYLFTCKRCGSRIKSDIDMDGFKTKLGTNLETEIETKL